MLVVMPISRKVPRDALDPQKIQRISGYFSALLELLNRLSYFFTSFHKIFDTTHNGLSFEGLKIRQPSVVRVRNLVFAKKVSKIRKI